MPTLAAMPIQRRPLVGPALTQPPPVAPTPTPTGTFTAPDPSSIGSDPAYQFRVDQANKGAQRSAAARGTLLSGGFQASLAKLNQGLASQEYDKVFGRSLASAGFNRDTNQQNFGQSLAGFGAQRAVYGDARDVAQEQAGVINANAGAEDLYAQQMAEYRAMLEQQQQEAVRRQNAEEAAQRGRPGGPSLGYRSTMPVLR